MAIKLGKKKIFIIAGVLAAAIGAYFALRKRKIAFYDNVWCGDGTCSDFSTQAQVNALMGSNFSGFNADGDNSGNDTGYFQLLFSEPHGLKEGDRIFVEQDAGATYPYYDGWTDVKKVINPFVVRTPKARQGNTPVNGGFVYVESWYSQMTA
jgi:hypothetical protein